MAAIVITSPVQGSIKVDTYATTPYASASPIPRYYANLQTVTIDGAINQTTPQLNYLQLTNVNKQPITSWLLSNIAQIGSSASPAFPTMESAINALAALIMK